MFKFFALLITSVTLASIAPVSLVQNPVLPPGMELLPPEFPPIDISLPLPYTQVPGVSDFLAMSVMVEIGRGNGSGVLFTREVDGAIKTYVLTAGHVAQAAKRAGGGDVTIRVEYRDGGRIVGGTTVNAKCIVCEDDAGNHGSGRPDLSLFEILQDDLRPLRVCASLHLGTIPEIGTRVAHVGCTRGLYNSYSRGVISQTDVTFAGENVDQTTVMAYPGSSGGGVWIEETGQLYGILVMGIGPGVNFVVPARHIIEWANANDIAWLYRSPC